MSSKQELDYQFEKLLARQAVANALMGLRTKAWKGGCTQEELENQAAAAVVKPQVAGKRVKGLGNSGSNQGTE